MILPRGNWKRYITWEVCQSSLLRRKIEGRILPFLLITFAPDTLPKLVVRPERLEIEADIQGNLHFSLFKSDRLPSARIVRKAHQLLWSKSP